MRIRGSWIMAIVAAATMPTWAHCGHCGEGEGSKTSHGEAPHGHDQEHGQTTAAIGSPAPDFALKGIDGMEYKLSDYKGKVVVLEWTNHMCPFVKRHQGEKKSMQKTFAMFSGKPVVWLAVDSSNYCEDKIDGITAWVKENDIEYPILLDAPGKVGHLYGATNTPHMFVIDQKGILAYKGALDDDAYGDKDSPRNYVEEAVTALLNGSTVATTTSKLYGCSVKYKK